MLKAFVLFKKKLILNQYSHLGTFLEHSFSTCLRTAAHGLVYLCEGNLALLKTNLNYC